MKITGWTEDQCAAASAATEDWFLAFDELERQLGQQSHAQMVKALQRPGG